MNGEIANGEIPEESFTAIILNSNQKVCDKFILTKNQYLIFYLEKNPLQLGTVWTIDGMNVDVHIFDNKEDYENQLAL